jgi:RecA/RadA recombinase
MNYNAKQKILLELTLSSSSVFSRCIPIIRPEYFDPELRKPVSFIIDYYTKYSAIPDSSIIHGETGASLETHELTLAEEKYCCDEVERFCRKQAVIKAIQAAPAHINDENYGAVEQALRDAMSVSLDTDLGIVYFKSPLARLEDQSTVLSRISTGYPQLDEAIGGGLARKESILFTANSGGGKSVSLSNLAINFLEQKLDVLYISLELSEALISQRFDMMFTGIKSVIAHQHIEEIAQRVIFKGQESGSLVIKRMTPGVHANHIRAYLKEYFLEFKKYPDLLILDYLDRFGTIENLSSANISQRDGKAAEEFYELGVEFNMVQGTASQQNREAIDAPQASQTHIQGGLTKINPMDVVAAVQLTPSMKAQGEVALGLTKTRSSDGVGRVIILGWNNNTLRMTNLDRTSNDLPTSKFVDRGSTPPNTPAFPPKPAGSDKPRRSLVDLID